MKRQSIFFKYYVLIVQMKDFNVLIDEKDFFDFRIKKDEEPFEAIVKMGRNNDCTQVIYWIMISLQNIAN